ncbi:right-handed parallel beta-helix repeat-containing protein [Flammeovirga sp. EKP202]|uniref:right-handed parallel beta-helix repeat-containing protein n=1 Tax=Flammeovirga sp. EKP202 TaxID=2770592 RepID=UPI00165FE917|nr:right-handed parallel beta-helix repeat-containing protein [Flammeovirga sp. EKP202]MBD0401735.1 right-handed parallel beta-helix repeat-containing protein [Flammeovirga sp. EKP202]
MKYCIKILLILLIQSKVMAEVYYVSYSDGNDKNNGLSVDQPFKTLEKVNNLKLSPGDQVLFKSNNVWEGQLELTQLMGLITQPIIISKYGKGERPLINGKGEKKYTVLLQNSEFVTVKNLVISNTGKKREARRVGVLVEAIDYGESHGLHLDSLKIQNVNGSLVKREGGGSGIFWKNHGKVKRSRFVDLKITNCHIYNCGRNAITSSGYAGRSNWYPSLGVIIRNNLIEKVPGDGIVPIATDGCIIEYNVMRDCPDILSHEEAAAGIWPWSTDNTLIQYNEVSDHKAKWDGQGFDSDYNSRNTIIQYNYSHDNYGGFLLVCNKGHDLGGDYNIGTENTIVRYNLSVNDGVRPYQTERMGWFSPVIHITGPVSDTKFYGNVIVKEKVANEKSNHFFYMDNWGGPWPINTQFFNNVFYTTNATKVKYGKDINTFFNNNFLYGIEDPDLQKRNDLIIDENVSYILDKISSDEDSNKFKRAKEIIIHLNQPYINN